MSIKTQILDTLKKLVGVYEQETFGKVYSESEIKISNMEVGGKVELIGADGELLPAEDGDYELADGSKFTVKGGQISAIEGQEAPTEEPAQEEEAAKEEEEEKPSDEEPVVEETPAEEPAPEEPKEEEAPAEEPIVEEPVEEQPAEEPQVDPVVKGLQDQVSNLVDIVENLVRTIEELKGSTATKEEVNAFSAQVADLDSNIKKLAKVPVEFSKTTTSITVKENKEEKLIELAKMLGRK